jgi:putative transposase
MERDRYKRGAHMVLELQYHFVWKTKYSYPVLQGDVGLRTRDFIKQISSEKGMVVVRGNVRANHIHVLISTPSHLSPSKMAQYLKGRVLFDSCKSFLRCRKGIGGAICGGEDIFVTVGAVTEEVIKKYIEDQSDEPGNFKVWDEQD